MPLVKAVVLLNKLPLEAASYHLRAVPVADKLETCAPAQKLCAALPVGAEVLLTVAVTANLELLSQLFKVCEA